MANIEGYVKQGFNEKQIEQIENGIQMGGWTSLFM